MDGSIIRRHLTASRRIVLDIVADTQPVTRDAITRAWVQRQPEMTSRHRDALPWMTEEVLWRLERLAWVEWGGGGYRLTVLGQRARKYGAPTAS